MSATDEIMPSNTLFRTAPPGMVLIMADSLAMAAAMGITEMEATHLTAFSDPMAPLVADVVEHRASLGGLGMPEDRGRFAALLAAGQEAVPVMVPAPWAWSAMDAFGSSLSPEAAGFDLAEGEDALLITDRDEAYRMSTWASSGADRGAWDGTVRTRPGVSPVPLSALLDEAGDRVRHVRRELDAARAAVVAMPSRTADVARYLTDARRSDPELAALRRRRDEAGRAVKEAMLRGGRDGDSLRWMASRVLSLYALGRARRHYEAVDSEYKEARRMVNQRNNAMAVRMDAKAVRLAHVEHSRSDRIVRQRDASLAAESCIRHLLEVERDTLDILLRLERAGVRVVARRDGTTLAEAAAEALARLDAISPRPGAVPLEQAAVALVGTLSQGVRMQTDADPSGVARCRRALPALIETVLAEGLVRDAEALLPGAVEAARRICAPDASVPSDVLDEAIMENSILNDRTLAP